ncbi:MAG TPA: SDR family oxidoreductase [Candidatus Limnocylindria bacterium]|nr:SDR family oxidoreductase [Candidatus Limnocylindria bacterium]
MSVRQAAASALVIGASGQVGRAVLRALDPSAVGTYRARPEPALRQLDARDLSALRGLLDELRPPTVFFPAAEPHVDWCETHPDDARAANVEPALQALAAARERDARFVFFSTDYVFDGLAGPYAEGDAVAPLSVYGRHKLEVEEHVLEAAGTVVRTTTVYGEEQPPGKNFVLRLVASLREGRRTTIPYDQLSTPTWSEELGRAAVRVADKPGIWHVAGPDLLSRDGFARMIADVFGLDPTLIEPIPTAQLAQPAARPMRAGLRTDKIQAATGMSFLPTREALETLRARL